jgi:NitT/TauT family transport system substrate-binding protein
MSPRRLAIPLIAALLVACSPSASPSEALRAVNLLLGFQPDVQFAPFYLAQQAGYYADAGLEVTIEYKSGADLVRLVGDGQAEFGVTDATDVMISRTLGIPIKYVATLYSLFPVALIGPAGTVPTDPAGLAGKRIGTPGMYGSSWHALLALLDAGGLTPDDVTIRAYPQFNQVDGLLNGDVDLITGFRANEPLRLAAQGMDVDVLTVEGIAPLPGPGVIVGDDLLADEPGLVEAFAHATVRALAAIARDPQVGLDAAIVAVPTIASDRATALAVLEATIELWNGSDAPDGRIDQHVWSTGYETMRRLGFIDGSVPLDEMTYDAMIGPY